MLKYFIMKEFEVHFFYGNVPAGTLIITEKLMSEITVQDFQKIVGESAYEKLRYLDIDLK